MSTETKALNHINLEDLKEEPKENMAGIRMNIPTPLDEVILKYQAAYKAAHPDERKMTKEHIIWQMMLIGAAALDRQATAALRAHEKAEAE